MTEYGLARERRRKQRSLGQAGLTALLAASLALRVGWRPVVIAVVISGGLRSIRRPKDLQAVLGLAR